MLQTEAWVLVDVIDQTTWSCHNNVGQTASHTSSGRKHNENIFNYRSTHYKMIVIQHSLLRVSCFTQTELTWVLRARLLLQQTSSDQPASPLWERFPQRTWWTPWKPLQGKQISWSLFIIHGGEGLWDPHSPAERALLWATQPGPWLHTPPAHSAPESRTNLLISPGETFCMSLLQKHFIPCTVQRRWSAAHLYDRYDKRQGLAAACWCRHTDVSGLVAASSDQQALLCTLQDGWDHLLLDCWTAVFTILLNFTLNIMYMCDL